MFIKNKNLMITLIFNMLLSMGFIGVLLYLLLVGRSNHFLGLDWAEEINYELIIIRASIANILQLTLLFMKRICQTHKNLKKNFMLNSIAIVTYLYLMTLASLIIKFFNISALINKIIIFLNVIGFFIMLYYIYIILRTFELLHTRLENEETLTKHLYKLSYTDKLTGLVNRYYLLSLFEDYLNKYDKNNFMLGVLFLDLDGFKPVNDNFGHDVGDKVLKEISNRLIKCTRNIDTVARIGGDEFVILIPNIADDIILKIIASRVIEVINEKICINNHEFTIGVSIGISIYSKDGLEIDELIKKADIAMYRVKKAEKNGYGFY
ncbi:GGDEF domain-containing protein [Clostridium peptidivorans]|uniref:GGDEF domain-containing protein n=1 Tax=Clostridium peptidivorans TaxID=100174 RepID=UPI0015CABCFB|nr:GGDEF domain-containing protein [Clostridium peptidivorans]